MLHTIRSAYGWTDEQILDHIKEYGLAWLNETIDLINEDRKRAVEERMDERRWLVHVLPLARTPMDKKGSKSLDRYAKHLLHALERAMPWSEETRRARIRERLKKPPQNVEPTVIE